jgi:hypothetical protein
MPRRKPSGSKAKRFFEFEGRMIPIAKDEATELYEEREDGSVNPKPMTVLLGYSGDLTVGTEFIANRLSERRLCRVLLIELEVDMHPGLGDYGQIRRRLLIEDLGAASLRDIADLSKGEE